MRLCWLILISVKCPNAGDLHLLLSVHDTSLLLYIKMAFNTDFVWVTPLSLSRITSVVFMKLCVCVFFFPYYFLFCLKQNFVGPFCLYYFKKIFVLFNEVQASKLLFQIAYESYHSFRCSFKLLTIFVGA